MSILDFYSDGGQVNQSVQIGLNAGLTILDPVVEAQMEYMKDKIDEGSYKDKDGKKHKGTHWTKSKSTRIWGLGMARVVGKVFARVEMSGNAARAIPEWMGGKTGHSQTLVREWSTRHGKKHKHSFVLPVK